MGCRWKAGLMIAMAKRPEEKKIEDIELHADAWARFERAVNTVPKSPPQHRAAKKKTKKAPPKRGRKSHTSS
jgi:hypothetical protein